MEILLTYVLRGVGISITLLSLESLTGRLANKGILSDYFLAHAPLSDITALFFLFCGISLLARERSWPRLTLASCSLVMAGIVILLLSALGNNAGFGLPLITDSLPGLAPARGSSEPYRMAILLLVAVAILLSLRQPQKSWLTPLIGALGTIMVVSGVLAFWGYGDTLPFFSPGEVKAGKVLDGALEFVLLGAGLLALACRNELRRMSSFPWWLMDLVSIGVLTISLILWQELKAREHEAIEHAIELQSHSLRGEFLSQLDFRAQLLVNLATWGERKAMLHQPDWKSFVEVNLQNNPGFQAVTLIDSSLRVVDVVPQAGNEGMVGLDVRLRERSLLALQVAQRQRSLAFSQTIELKQGGRGFGAFVPLFAGETFLGALTGVFRYQTLFDLILQHVAPEYAVTIFEGEEKIYQRGTIQVLGYWQREHLLPLHGVTWRMRIAPTPALLAHMQSTLPELTFASGLIAAFFLSCVGRSLRQVKQYAQVSDAANRQLAQEMDERLKAEAALRKAHNHLELRVRERTEELLVLNKQLSAEIAAHQQTEKSLRQSEELFRAFMDHLPAIAFLKDTEGRYVYFNKPYHEHIAQGRPFSAWLGKPDTELHSPEAAAQFRAQDGIVLSTNTTISMSATLAGSGGMQEWAGFKFPVRLSTGQLLLGGVSIDVTEQKRAEQQLQTERDFAVQIMATMGQGLAVVNADSCIEYVNPTALRMTGYQQEEVLGKPIAAFSQLVNEFQALQRRERLRRGETVAYEMHLKHVDGHFLPVLITAAPRWLNGKRTGSIFVLSDLTERKHAEELLRASEERYRIVSQSISDYAFSFRLADDGEIMMEWLTESFHKVTGYSVEEIINAQNARAIYIHPDDIGRVSQIMRNLRPGATASYELRIIRKDGAVRWLRSRVQGVGDDEGNLLRVCGAVRDITEEKRAEEIEQQHLRHQAALVTLGELALSRLPLTVLFRQAVDLVARTLEVEYCKILELLPNRHAFLVRGSVGWTAEDQSAASAGSDPQADYLLEKEELIGVDDLRTETRFPETPFLSEHGVVSGLSVPIGNEAQPFGVLTAHTQSRRNFTEQEKRFLQAVANLLAHVLARINIEEQLRNSEQHYRMLFDSNPLPMWLTDTEQWIFLDVNQAALQQYGYSRDEFLAMTAFDLYCSEEVPVLDIIKEQLSNQSSYKSSQVFRQRRKDGTVFFAQITADRIIKDGMSKWLVVVHDVTIREMTLQHSRQQLSRSTLLHRIGLDINAHLDLPSIFQTVLNSLEGEMSVSFSCFYLWNTDLAAFQLSTVGSQSRALLTSLTLDTQTAVVIAEDRLRGCLHKQLVYEPDTTRLMSPVFCRFASAGLHSLVVTPLVVEGETLGLLLVARSAREAFESADCKFLRQLGDQVALAVHQAQLYTQLQQAYDDLRLTQQAVLQQERLHAVGQMACGIAHDINNAIFPAVLYVDSLLARNSGVSADVREDLVLVKQTLGDITQTVARLRSFYRKTEDDLAMLPVNLNEVVHSAIELSRMRWRDLPQQSGTTITVYPLLEEPPPVVLGVESELRQALLNLIFNAVDAMPDGGELTIRTQTTSTAILLQVSDTGVGMDEKTRQRCLEPFFTTKGDRGTGLGLAIVYGILRRHAAQIDMASVVGQGTTIDMTFPLLSVEGEPNSCLGLATEEVPPPLRILVVDDDPMVRNSTQDILCRDGHDVVVADGGEAGITTFLAAQEEHPFAVVITDLGMPKVDGREVARRVKSAAPTTFVVLLTGWGRQMLSDGDFPAHIDCLLSKPLGISELRTTLWRVSCPPNETTRQSYTF